MATASRHIVWEKDWSGFMWCRMECDLNAEITDVPPYVLTMTITDFQEQHRWSVNETTGVHFINTGGLMWYIGDVDNWSPQVTESETSWEPVHQELLAADPNFDQDVIYGVYASDEGPNPQVQGTLGVNYTRTYDYGNSFPDPNMPVVSGFSRAVVPDQGYQVRVSMGTWAGVYDLTIEQLLNYFPASTRQAAAWHWQDSEGLGVYARRGSSWDEVKNLEGYPDHSSCFLRRNGAWELAPKQ